MKKKNQIEKSKYIYDRYKEYLRSSFKFGSEELQKLFEEQIDKEDLFKGPYVDLNLEFQRGKNLTELIDEGVVCKSFLKLKNTDFKRPLYSHQEEALRNISAGRSAVITTGTNSGKTECFLYPILNELLFDIEKGNIEPGIRVIFLYPMNALVNDQIDRVRNILMDCPDITYGFFTGETKETVGKTYRETYAKENNTSIPENELVSREEIRANPPHLLFTNYSMLEHLLIRPNDYSIFKPERLKNWKYIVLDEAHSYNGSKGIELSFLMRRLTGLAQKKPRFILTSATLGEEGKSEDEIVDFARSLTSANFDIHDIIWSKRINLKPNAVKYKIWGNDYTCIKAVINSKDQLKTISSKYKNTECAAIEECLYGLLISDKNVYKIYDVLKHGSKTFEDLSKEFGSQITAGQLADLIDLINKAEKNGIGLFDLKYHSFVRPLSGAYITLGNQPKLSLTKTNELGGLKAFEVGNCKYCNSPYLIGKIQHSEYDDLDHLLQNNEVDIYDNYGNNKYASVDYFLLKNAVNEDETNYSILEEYTVCSACGAIHPTENLNAKKCSCDDAYKVTIYKVEQKNKENDNEELAYNNINQCPCCGHRSKSGVIKNLNLGKDEGTALIAQFLFEAIDEENEEQKKKPKLSLKLNPKNQITEIVPKAKQFLSFSDSRQQASFAAVFFDANHVRMLRKRLIWKIIEDKKYRNIPVEEMTAELTSMIKEKNLFPNDLNAQKNAWITVMIDLLKVDGVYDGEGLGLYFFDLDLSEIMSQISEEDVEEEFGKYNITKNDLETMMQVIFGIFKTTPAINYVKSTLTLEEKRDALDYRRFDNYIMLEKTTDKKEKHIRSFLPINKQDNMAVRYVMKACSCDSETAKSIMEMLFNNLGVRGNLFKKHDSEEAYQIDAGKYIIKNYKTSDYYMCSKCGRLTPYNVHNVCTHDKCDGKLMKVNPDEALSDNFYRNEYKNKKIESVVIKEHTAQLSHKKAKQYQLDFKNKKINILSCSTTFEMGIDIGTLETVFMRNVPPSPANYVQRAGRAGRRNDSAAFILTYCGTNSHDYTYFCEPEKMISGAINPPHFNITNKKIILRHLMAACLGYFFRKYPDYCKTINGLVFENGVEEFKKYVSSHPEDLSRYINEKVIPEEIFSDYHNFKWFDDIDGKCEKLEDFVNNIREIAEEYKKAKEEALKDENYNEANYYKGQLDKLQKEKTIDCLSKYCVIPKYGFPVDVVELKVYNEGVFDFNYSDELKRDLKIAISEYAPDSEVIVDKKKHTSKYISLPKVKGHEFTKNYFCTCSNCKKINVFRSIGTGSKCKYCGESIASEKAEFYYEPVYGFKTGETKESTHMKPKRSYSGEVSYLEGDKKDEQHLEIANTIMLETSSDNNLLVLNKSAFYMCPKCGYSDIAKRKDRLPEIIKDHKNCRGYACVCNKLDRIKLGHSFQTDVARFTIPLLNIFGKEGFAKAMSFMYAFLEGISIALNIDRDDIDGVLEQNLEYSSYDILIYDNVPGGAGHVKRLLTCEAINNALNASYKKVSQHCCDENTSCYNCLRNYYNRSYHSILKRRYAKEIIETLLTKLNKN